MEDLRAVARMLRWTSESIAFNLQFLPPDRLDWKPEPDAKSAMEIVGEVVASMQMMQPVFSGGEWQRQEAFPHPQTVEEARSLLSETTRAYAAALEAAGPGLERETSIMGNTVWAARLVLFPVIEAIHHHGQIAYIQSLLGDRETHFDMESMGRMFGPG